MEYDRLMIAGRKKDFIFLERMRGRAINIREGIERHTHGFSVTELEAIADYVYMLR